MAGRLEQTRACQVSISWGGGMPAKTAWLDWSSRRIMFLNNRPATLPECVELPVEQAAVRNSAVVYSFLVAIVHN
jgi:hypothetical protein